MPKLILKRKAEVLAEFPLRSGNATYSIGSDSGNDLTINDKTVSMTHFYVERQGNQYFVRDLKSAFGTFVNGERISSKVEIRDGDTIEIGEHTLIFKNPLENQPPEQKGKPRQAIEEFWGDVKESVLNVPPSANGGHVEDEVGLVEEAELISQAKHTAVKPPMRADSQTDKTPAKIPSVSILEKSPYYLLAVHGPYIGKKYQLNFGETKVGRDVKLNDIVIRLNKKGEVDPSVSRRHATISYRDGGFYVTDKRSQSRTYVNEHRLSETEEMQLVPGDEIEIVSDQQSTIFRFVAEGNWDFHPPRKAGEWYIRYRRLAIDVGTLAMLAISAVFGYQALDGWMMTTDKPNPFKVVHEKFQPVDAAASEVRPDAAKDGFGEPVARDFNGDDYVDYAYAHANGVLVAIDGKSRRRLWQASGVIVDATKPFTVGDLNNNGLDDLVVVTSDGRLCGIDGLYGAEIWASPIFENSIVASAAVGDFDRDGLRDVAVITKNDKLEVGYSRVNNIDWVEIDLGISSRVAPSVADLDGNRADEILVVTENGLILVYNGMERRISETIDINETLNKARGSFAQVYEVRYPVATADMSGDGILDLAVVTIRGEVLCIDGESHRAWWWAEAMPDGQASLDSLPATLVLGDLDKNNLPDVLISHGNGLYAFCAARRDAQQEQPFWEHIDDASTAISTQIAAIDFDRDGATEVVRVREGRVQIIGGIAGQMLWESSDEPAAFADNITPLIADFKNDGNLDILLFDRTGTAHLFSTNRRVKSASVIWGQRHATAGNASLATFETTSSGHYLTILAICAVISFGAVVGNLLARRQRKAFVAN